MRKLRFAANQLIFPDGLCLKQQVVELDSETHRLLNHFALSEEIPFTEWLGGTFIVSTVAEMSIPLTSQSVREVINCLQSDELNASAIAPKNIESYTLYIWYTPTVSLDNEVKSVRRL